LELANLITIRSSLEIGLQGWYLYAITGFDYNQPIRIMFCWKKYKKATNLSDHFAGQFSLIR